MQLLFKNKDLEEMYYNDDYTTKRYHQYIIQEYRETVFLLQSVRDIQSAWKYRSLNVEKYQKKYSARVTK
ncbi:TPA: hypothetical protein DEP21_04515 [Patescibacteria group bacterium]|nr:hypothetical protein [Candidatus Gracilibacteria bacterium]